MELYILIPLLCCIIVIIVLSIKLKKKQEILEKTIIQKHEIEVAKTNELKDYFREEWRREENELDKNIRSKRESINLESIKLDSNFQIKETKLASELHLLEETLKEKEKRYNEVNQDLDLYRSGKINEINQTAAEYEQRRQIEIKNELEEYYKNWLTKYDEEISKIADLRTQKLEELEKVKNELEEERSKRAAINEEIRRQREVEEQQDFYRIQLQDGDAEDVEILRSITGRLRHPEAINKVIWSGYYQKPLTELRKRVAIDGSGIYKITRMKTGEIYIGQAVNVSTRWADHVKTALGVGTLASSQLHRVMSQDGCENFLFELLESTPKEKLKERESYYIDFYDSKNYGLNSIRGEQK